MAKKRNNSRAKSRVCIRGDHIVSGEEIMCGRCCGVAGSDRLVSSGSCLLFSLVCSLSCSPCMAPSSSLQMAFSGHVNAKCQMPPAPRLHTELPRTSAVSSDHPVCNDLSTRPCNSASPNQLSKSLGVQF